MNETLEYFVANSAQLDSLNGFTGHDTNGVATEDLMASPQFVIDAAYATLRNERPVSATADAQSFSRTSSLSEGEGA